MCLRVSLFSVRVFVSIPPPPPLQVDLPLCLFCQLVPPVKTAAYKITVATNRNPPQVKKGAGRPTGTKK